MTPTPRPATRGRPPTITRERIADAGIAIGLPSITFVGVAAALGVSHMALYKHVPSLEALKHLVAEEIFSRWKIPRSCKNEGGDLKAYLLEFSASAQTLVKQHPGVAPYVLRRLAATPQMLAKIDEHQTHIAGLYHLTKDQSRWLLATVAFHCISVADTVYTVAGKEPEEPAARVAEEIEMEQEFAQGMQALIIGALAMMKEGVVD